MTNHLAMRGAVGGELLQNSWGSAEPDRRPHPQPPPEAAAQDVPPLLPNPSVRIDPSLGIVVLEFRDYAGAVETTLPTSRQLAAYRAASMLHAPLPVDLANSVLTVAQPDFARPDPQANARPATPRQQMHPEDPVTRS